MSIVTQFDLLRIQDERLEDEFYNSNSTADRLKRACQTADLPCLIECMEAEDFTTTETISGSVVKTLIQSYNSDMSEQCLDCIQFAVENGCIFDSSIFDELSINNIENSEVIYYLLSKYDEVNTEKETIFTLFNSRGACSTFKRYLRELLLSGKIDTQEERWKTFLQGLVDNCPGMTKSLKDTITNVLL